MLEDLIGVKELARLLDVPEATVYGFNHKKTGPRPIRVGKHVRYRPSEVQRWIDSRTAATESAA